MSEAHAHKDIMFFSSLSKQTAEWNQLASPEFGLKLLSILLLLSNCFANEAHPGTVSKKMCYMCSFLEAVVSEPSSFSVHMHSSVLSSLGGMDKHAKQGEKLKAASLCLLSLSVCCFCGPHPD